ncbi:MAG TPA: YciI family protein [Streptosporangiaceae bacterium]|jgi:hypothetical protein
MRYALLVREDETVVTGPQERSRRVAGLAAFRRGLEERGALVGAGQLCPADMGATLRCWDGGDIVTTSGPFAGTREQITGFAVVDCKDLDEAIEMAAAIPAAWYGAIEVRQVQDT